VIEDDVCHAAIMRIFARTEKPHCPFGDAPSFQRKLESSAFIKPFRRSRTIRLCPLRGIVIQPTGFQLSLE
jgi:hypothetical protein